MEKKELVAEVTFNEWINIHLQIINGVNGLHLSDSECFILKEMILKYYDLKQNILTDKAVFESLFSVKSRKEYRANCNTDTYTFNNRFQSIKMKGMIINTSTTKTPSYILNPIVMPVKELTFKFDIKEN